MGTRAFIGHLPTPDAYTARYTHWDGGPMSMGPTIAAIIDRDGANPTIDTIMSAPAGWSIVDPRTPDPTGTEPDASAEHWTPGYFAHLIECGQYDPEQYQVRPGIGVAYADTESSEIEGTINVDTGTATAPGGWIEWGYLIDPQRGVLHILEGTTSRVAATLPLDALADADWAGIECGPSWEQCSHYAWFHDPEVDRATSITMRKWTGIDPLTQSDAIAAILNGDTYTLTGTSMGAAYRRRRHDGIPVVGRVGKASSLYLGHTESGQERWFALSDTSPVTDLALFSLVMPKTRADQ